MRERLIEILRDARNKCDETKNCIDCVAHDKGGECFWYLYADRLLAEGVVVPPCKVGDTVYFISREEIIPMIVNCISFNGNYEYCLTCNYVDEEQHGYSILSFTDKVRGYRFGFTKEEAEKALAEREGKG